MFNATQPVAAFHLLTDAVWNCPTLGFSGNQSHWRSAVKAVVYAPKDVNLRSESLLHVNPGIALRKLAQVLAKGKARMARLTTFVCKSRMLVKKVVNISVR
jgi:hypothetical protein